MPSQSDPQPRAAQFAAYVRDTARRAGYDVDSPRGGGRTALARDTGMSPSSVGRMLSGQAMPDPSFLAPLAKALRVPLAELFVLSGLMPRDELSPEAQAAEPHPLSPREAAAGLGIKDPHLVELFETMTRAFLKEQNVDSRSESGRVA